MEATFPFLGPGGTSTQVCVHLKAEDADLLRRHSLLVFALQSQKDYQ